MRRVMAVVAGGVVLVSTRHIAGADFYSFWVGVGGSIVSVAVMWLIEAFRDA